MLNKTFLATLISLMIFSLILIPFAVFAVSSPIVQCGTEKDASGNISNACTVCDLFTLVDRVVDFMLEVIAFPLAVIMFLYGGFMWITAGGDSGKITKGRKAIEYAVYGMIVAFAAWLIIDTILKALLSGGMGKIQGWGFWHSIPKCSH